MSHEQLFAKDDREEKKQSENFCKYHVHNQVHLFCETCNDLLCDKCLIEEHEDHKIEDFQIANNNDFVVNLLTNFHKEMTKINDVKLKNFKETTFELEKVIDVFFQEEVARVEKMTNELRELLKNLNSKVRKLVSIYQQKFRDEFTTIREDYERFQEETHNILNRVNAFKNETLKGPAARFKEFKDFKIKKRILEADTKRLLGFYNLNKTALISEFSMKEFFSFLEKNRIFLTKHYEEYSKSIGEVNVSHKINEIVTFDEDKMRYTSKNFLPRNMCKIYQPIDRTNTVVIYDGESESFKRLNIYPKKLSGFAFLPFSRYLNFNGRLFVSGGYEDSKLSRTFWAIEDKTKYQALSSKNPNMNLSHSNTLDYNVNLNSKNFSFEDENNNGMVVHRCANMVNPRAGHAMLGLTPSLIFAFGGCDGVKSCEMYHYDTNRWEEISQLNESRIDPSAFIHKNHIYVFFGLRFERTGKKYNFLTTIERISLLNMQNAEWEYITPKYSESLNIDNLPRSLCGIVVKYGTNDSIYILGGQTDKDTFSNDIYEFDIENNFLSLSEKKLPKASAFLEQNYLYLFHTAINFDIYGDLFYYHNTDTFNFYFQKV